MTQQLDLELIYEEELWPSEETYYVQCLLDDGSGEEYGTFTISGEIAGKDKDGRFLVDPGGSGYYMFKVTFDQIYQIEATTIYEDQE